MTPLSSSNIKPLSPVRVGKEPIFSPDWDTGYSAKGLSEGNIRVKHVKAFEHTLDAAVEYSRNSAAYADNALKQLIDVGEQTRQLTLETKQHQLAQSLQAVYLANDANVEACNQGWNAVIEKAKKDNDFKSVAGETGIATFADNIIQPYRFDAARKTIARNNQKLHDISVQQIKQKQNDLSIAYAAMASTDLQQRENGFLLYSNAVTAIGDLVDKTNMSGEPVFNEAQKAAIVTGNVDILAQSYARARYAKTDNLTDKLKLIEEIGNGTHTVNLKEFFNIPETFVPKDAKEAVLGEFSFGDVLEGTRERLVKELDAQYEKEVNAVQKAEKANLAKRVLDGEVAPNPRHAMYQEAASAYYSQLWDNDLKQIFANKDPRKYQQLIQLHTDFVKNFQFVPSRMTDAVEALMQHPDPMLVATACTLTDILVSEYPHAVLEDKNFLQKGSVYVYGAKLFNNGTPPDIIASLVRGSLNVDERIKKERKEQFDDAVRKEGKFKIGADIPASTFKKDFFSWSPKYPTFMGRNMEMEYEYHDLVRGFYIMNGDMDSAKKTAIALLRQKWGVTEINGQNEVVPYAIEDFYCNDAFTLEKLKLKTLEYINRVYKKHEMEPVTNLDGIAVRHDTTTVREIQNGQFPTYRIYFKNENGQYDDTLYGEEVRLSLSNVWDKKAREASGIFDTATQINQMEALKYMAKHNKNIEWMQKQNKLYQKREKLEETLSNKTEGENRE